MKRLMILCVMLAFSLQAKAQNEIEHYSTIWPSGYGKMAFDGDTLYINILNGQAVERYNIADPFNPDFIDREEVSGFDQIDFEHQVMATENDGVIYLTSFDDFIYPQQILRLDLSSTGGGPVTWKYRGDAIFTVAHDDTIRAYDISDPGHPHVSSVCGLIRNNISSDHNSLFGNSVFISSKRDDTHSTQFLDVYDIRNPENIDYAFTDPEIISPMSICDIFPGRGDTIAVFRYDILGAYAIAAISRFSPDDSIPRLLWYQDNGGIQPSGFFAGINGYYFMHLFYSYSNFMLLGSGDLNLYNFGVSQNDYVFSASLDHIDDYQPSYSESHMNLAYSDTLDHYGVLSTCAYGDYILAGMESNGGELIVHSIGDDWDLYDSGYLPGVPAKKMIVDGSTVMCLCDDKLVAADFTNPGHPTILHELTGLNGTLVDFARDENFYCVVTDHKYYVINYNSIEGFSIGGTLDLPGAPITSIVHYELSYVLRGSVGTILKIDPHAGGQPYIWDEYNLPHTNYSTLGLVNFDLWASGSEGTDVMNLFFVEPQFYYGPEYFSDARRFYFSNDTLYAADGVNGLKVFTANWGQSDTLRYLGSYHTGNVVNQIAFYERNFYVSDYYSLQHLRWGAPDAIGGNPISHLPDIYTLEQNYPNPFNSSTSISYVIPDGKQATINIFDICGREVRAIPINDSGNTIWNGRDDADKPVSSGVYFYSIAGQPETARKMLLIK